MAELIAVTVIIVTVGEADITENSPTWWRDHVTTPKSRCRRIAPDCAHRDR
jgi:hypothetical protein